MEQKSRYDDMNGVANTIDNRPIIDVDRRCDDDRNRRNTGLGGPNRRNRLRFSFQQRSGADHGTATVQDLRSIAPRVPRHCHQLLQTQGHQIGL